MTAYCERARPGSRAWAGAVLAATAAQSGHARATPLLFLVQVHEPATQGHRHRMRAIAHAQLAEDAVDVVLDRRLRDPEPARDLAVVVSARHAAQDLGLARREVVEPGVALLEAGGQRRRHPAPPGVHRPDGLEQLGAR